MTAQASIGVALATVGLLLAFSLFKEPQGGQRTLYRLLFGRFAFSGDGADGATGGQKGLRALSLALLWGAAAYFLYEGLR